MSKACAESCPAATWCADTLSIGFVDAKRARLDAHMRAMTAVAVISVGCGAPKELVAGMYATQYQQAERMRSIFNAVLAPMIESAQDTAQELQPYLEAGPGLGPQIGQDGNGVYERCCAEIPVVLLDRLPGEAVRRYVVEIQQPE